MLHKSSIRLRLLARRVLRHEGSPERAARGLAAGFFAAAIPLPGFQIPLSLLLAWVVRGHKGIAILPQFLSNAGTMLPLAYCQYWLGTRLWLGTAPDSTTAMREVDAAFSAWSWAAPMRSLENLFASLGSLGADVLGPLTLGVLASAVALAALAYPLGLIAMSQYELRRMRRAASRGVGVRPPRQTLFLPPEKLTLPDDEAIRGYLIHHQTYMRADAIKLLIDGRQAFPEMLGCIAAARRTIDLETYILRADGTGRRFGQALAAAARRGVRTRLMYDGVGSLGLPQEFVNELVAMGVQVAVYRPIAHVWRIGLRTLNRRNHRKVLTVDERTSFTGGLNISDEYADAAEGGAGWRDTHVRVDGAESARQFALLFQETWENATEFAAPPADPNALKPAPVATSLPGAAACTAGATSYNATVQVLSNQEFLRRVRMRRAYLHAIRHAQRYILIENAYFIPDRGIRRALYHAVRRGVVVAVAIAMHSDVKLAAMASHALYGELLEGGVRLYEYPISMLHSKVAVIDDVWSIVSSYNLDHRSLLHSLEAGVLILDRPFARALRERIVIDIARSREVTRQSHAARPWNETLACSFAYQLRYWL